MIPKHNYIMTAALLAASMMHGGGPILPTIKKDDEEEDKDFTFKPATIPVLGYPNLNITGRGIREVKTSPPIRKNAPFQWEERSNLKEHADDIAAQDRRLVKQLKKERDFKRSQNGKIGRCPCCNGLDYEESNDPMHAKYLCQCGGTFTTPIK